MRDIKVSKDFYLWEFVPPDIYEKYGENSMWFLDPKIIKAAQFTRDFFKRPIYINTWKLGSVNGHIYKDSGFRTPETVVNNTSMASLSQHVFGRAVDLKITNIPAPEVQEEIKAGWRQFKEAGITAIELGTETWTHLDVRSTNMEPLLEIPYYTGKGGKK